MQGWRYGEITHLGVGELRNAPARADKLEYHPTDLVDIHRLPNALRHRLTNVAREDGVGVRLSAQEFNRRELADGWVLPLTTPVDGLYVEDLGAGEAAGDDVVPHGRAPRVQLRDDL